MGIDEDDLLPGGVPPLGKVTFNVRDVWKGVSEESVAVYGQGPEASCGIDFEKGENYLVYAYHSNGNEGAPLETGLCNATKPLAEAEGDLRVLGPPDATLPDTGGAAALLNKATTIVVITLLLFALAGAF